MFNLFVKKNVEYNCPEVVNTLPENENSMEVIIDTVDASDLKQVSDKIYKITGRDYLIYNENNLLASKLAARLHIVLVRYRKFNSNNGILYSDNTKLIHIGAADGKVPSEFSALFFVDNDTLSYKVYRGTGDANDSRVMVTVRELDANYIVAVSSDVFTFNSVKRLDDFDRFMFNNRYCEYLTNSEASFLLSAENASEKLQNETVILNAVVGYGDFDKSSYNISDYLMNEFETV